MVADVAGISPVQAANNITDTVADLVIGTSPRDQTLQPEEL